MSSVSAGVSTGDSEGVAAAGRQRLHSTFAQVAGACVFALGCLVMYGWIIESQFLVRIHPEWASMKFNTALMLATLGAGVFFLALGGRIWALAAGLLAVTVGFLTELQYVLAVDIGIDRVLMEPFSGERGVLPGRMSPVTAGLFMLIGAGLTLLAHKPNPWRASVAGVLAALTAGMALAALMGYATSTPAAYAWGAVTSVAVHTAASFLLLAGGVAACASAWERARLPEWSPWAAFIAGLACTLALGAALYAEQDPQRRTLTPELTLAVGALFSLTIAIALRSRAQIERQRDQLSAALQRSERALAERAQLAAVVESSSEAILTIDRDTRIVTCNRAAEQLYGYSAAELQGRSVRTLVPEDRQLEFEGQVLRRLRDNDAIRRLRTRRLHKSGALLDVEIDVSRLYGRYGEWLGAVSIARDISEHIAVEQTVSGVLEAAPDAMIISELDGRIVLVNHAAEEMFGYSRAELLSSRIEQLVPEAQRAAHEQFRAGFPSGGGARIMNRGRELAGQRRDGSLLPIDVALSMLQLPRRSLVIAAVRDVTERREAEQRLRESLHEKELLLKEIHHRVKNNLQVVASMLGLQAEQAHDPAARVMLGECRERVMSMALVHQKLYGAADVRRIDLAELVREIATMLTSGAARVAVRFDLESVIADIETAFPLSLIVNELITNALRHAFAGRERGVVAVSVRRVAQNAVSVEIADDGVGGVTRATFERSTTLGSTIVRRLVRQLDGELTIGPGPGVRVTVRFPVPEPQA